MLETAYRSARATLFCGDAREILPSLGGESVDLFVSDPPYGVKQRANTRQKRFDLIEGDDSPEAARQLLADVTPDIIRTVRRSRHLYTFGLPLEHELVPTYTELIWDKGRVGSGDMQSPWGPQHEHIYFQVRAPDRYNAEKGTGKLAAKLRKGSVLTVKRLSALQVRRHPTEKPVDLLRSLIESSSLHDELILDPFAGSGSTLVAALLEGRRAIGIELDEGYAEVAARRLEEAEKVLNALGVACA